MNKAGARCHSYLSELVKIALTDTTDNEEEYAEIADIYDIPVVSCNWIKMSYRCGKLLPTKPFPPSMTTSALFKEKVFCASHLQKSDMDALWGMITFNGGLTQKKIDSRVTHLINANVLGKRYLASEGLKNVKIVTPDWVADCIKAKTILDEGQYQPGLLIGCSPYSRSLPVKIEPVTSRHSLPTADNTAEEIKPGASTMASGSSSHMSAFAGSNSIMRPKFPVASSTRPSLHEMPSGFPGYFNELESPGLPQQIVRPLSAPQSRKTASSHQPVRQPPPNKLFTKQSGHAPVQQHPTRQSAPPKKPMRYPNPAFPPQPGPFGMPPGQPFPEPFSQTSLAHQQV